MSEVSIRYAAEADLMPMEEAFGLWKFRLNNQRAFAEYRAGRLLWLVADVGGAPLGSVWGELFPEHDRTGRTLHVVAFRVHESVRRMGIGTKLLLTLEAEGIRLGRTVSTLYVEQSNGPAIALYKKLGYSIVDVRFARWDFEDPAGDRHVLTEEQFVMKKNLVASPGIAETA